MLSCRGPFAIALNPTRERGRPFPHASIVVGIHLPRWRVGLKASLVVAVLTIYLTQKVFPSERFQPCNQQSKELQTPQVREPHMELTPCAAPGGCLRLQASIEVVYLAAVAGDDGGQDADVDVLLQEPH